jgi:hypothetical protein
VTVPPVFGVVDGVLDALELADALLLLLELELPHALTAAIDARDRTATNADLANLLTDLPPLKLSDPGQNLFLQRRDWMLARGS